MVFLILPTVPWLWQKLAYTNWSAMEIDAYGDLYFCTELARNIPSGTPMPRFPEGNYFKVKVKRFSWLPGKIILIAARYEEELKSGGF